MYVIYAFVLKKKKERNTSYIDLGRHKKYLWGNTGSGRWRGWKKDRKESVSVDLLQFLRFEPHSSITYFFNLTKNF